jgi:SAM-dependent methyltransferase
VVRHGYNSVGRRYLEALSAVDSAPRSEYLAALLKLLKAKSVVLDLGSGPGYPVARALAESHRVVAVDVSERQLSLARRHAPAARFVQADMTRLHFRPASFDAMVALYSLTHVPRDCHRRLLGRVAKWLTPGGFLVASMGARDVRGSVEQDWFGVPMFFSNFDEVTNLDLVPERGVPCRGGTRCVGGRARRSRSRVSVGRGAEGNGLAALPHRCSPTT